MVKIYLLWTLPLPAKGRELNSEYFVVAASSKVTDKARPKCLHPTTSSRDFCPYLKELNLESLQDKPKTWQSFLNQSIQKNERGELHSCYQHT